MIYIGVSKGKLAAEDMQAALDRISATTDMEAFSACQLVVEAAIENLDLKKQVFADLDRICPPEAVLASNTSSLAARVAATVETMPPPLRAISS